MSAVEQAIGGLERPSWRPQRRATPLYSQGSVTESLMRDLLRKRRQKRKKMGICSPSWRPSPLKHWVPAPRAVELAFGLDIYRHC